MPYIFKDKLIYIKTRPTNKLEPKFTGPYRVIIDLPDYNYVEIRDVKNTRKISYREIKPCKVDENVIPITKASD